MTLSSRWAGRTHTALGRTTDKATRLALALGVVKSATRVVDRSLPPMTVQWSQVNPDETAPVRSMSYTDFKGGTINVNPMAMLDEAIGHAAGLDVSIGFAIHEAGHSQESRDRFKYLVKRETVKRPNARPDTDEDMAYRRFISNPTTVFNKVTGEATREVPAFEPMRIAAYLWNLVEDVRMEQATAKRWPGFAPYFGAVLDYMWADMRRRHELPTEYGPTLTERMRVVFLACRYPGRLASMTSVPELASEITFWQAWQHDYLSDAVDTPTTIQRGLDHLAEDEATKAELDKEVAAEKREREADERLRDQINRLIREGIKGGFEVCVTDNGEMVPIDAETAEAVRQLVREGLVEHQTIVPYSGDANVPVLVRKPEETPASRRAYIGRPDATTEALRAALVFRASAPEHSEKLLRSGSIDDDELYRWGAGDYRVFGQRVIESKPDVFLGLLVDCSGSMRSRGKLDVAQKLARLFVYAVHDQEGVETAVWAHTADVDGEATEVYRIMERGDPMSRLGLLETLPNSNNRDGSALEYVVSQVALAQQPERLVVVLSDGIPSGNSYGGRPAMNHVRSVVKWAEQRHGIKVIQIALDPHDLRPQDQEAMYPSSWIGFRDYASLPKQLAQLMARYL